MLEELLNKLIEKGWCPFWDKRITNVSWKMQYVWTYNWVFWSNHNVVQFWKSTRELTSKSSWLWQFVCENGMVNDNKQYSFIKRSWKWRTDERNQKSYKYRLIETSLKNEDELEQFLLDNIKIDE
jgi:hypothetical protein